MSIENTKITITATLAVGKPGKFVIVAANSVGELHRDIINLNSEHSRKRFITETLREAYKGQSEESQPAGVRDDLRQQILALARVPPGAPEPLASAAKPVVDDPRVEELAKMPEHARAAAESLLRDPKLLEHVSNDITSLGVVGENNNKLILYLVGTSTQLPRPLAAIVRGASSSGKSFLTEKVASLFPPEVVLYATSLTTNALYYFPSGALRHQWIVAGERSRIQDDDKAEATRALREMIEGGKLSKAVPMKEGDRIVTAVIKQEGPIAYSETTTLSHIDEEDANRCLLLNTDEGQSQTERILAATAEAATGRDRPNVDHIRTMHYAIQRMIPRTDVVIPFAEVLADFYPGERIEGRRDFRHLLQLVKASALLFFKQRNRDTNGRVIATLNDYAVAERLARGPLGVATGGISDGARFYLVQLREKFGEDNFSTSQAKKLGSASRRTLTNRLHELNATGAVEQTEPPKGNVPAKWKLTGVTPKVDASILPTVEQMREAFEQYQHADKPQLQIT